MRNLPGAYPSTCGQCASEWPPPSCSGKSTSRSRVWEGGAMENTWRSRELLSLFLPLDADTLKNIWTWRGRILLWWPQPRITSAMPVHAKATGKQTTVCMHVCPHCGNYSDTDIMSYSSRMLWSIFFFLGIPPHPNLFHFAQFLWLWLQFNLFYCND